MYSIECQRGSLYILVSERSADIAPTVFEFEAVQKEVERLQQIYSHQDMSGVDAQRINVELNQLKRQKELASKENDDLERDIKAEEALLMKEREMVRVRLNEHWSKPKKD